MEYRSKKYSSVEVKTVEKKTKKNGLTENQKLALRISAYVVIAIVAVVWVLSIISVLISSFSQDLTYDVQRYFKINFNMYYNLGGNGLLGLIFSTIFLVFAFIQWEKIDKESK